MIKGLPKKVREKKEKIEEIIVQSEDLRRLRSTMQRSQIVVSC